MPNVDFSGEIFSLDAAAGFDEGFIAGNVGAGSRLDFKTRLVACHGLSIEGHARAVADAKAEIGILWLLGGLAEGAAFGAAGVELTAHAPIDPFDSVGLDIAAAAYAEAALAGRLAVSLNLDDVAAVARRELDGPALEIFIAMLRELKVGAGVWARMSAAAMASAYASMRFSLADDDDAGFVIEAGAAAGVAAGVGADFYAGAKFESPKRFYLTAVDIITGTIAAEARRRLPPALHVGVTALEYVLPATFHAAYEVAQIPSAELMADPKKAADAFAASFAAELQRFVLDKLALGAATLVAGQIDGLVLRRLSGTLNSAQRHAAVAAVTIARDTLLEGTLTLKGFNKLLPHLIEAFDSIDKGGRDTWRQPIAALWLFLAAADALRGGIVAAHAQASAGVIGLGTLVQQGAKIEIADVPDFVREELREALGTRVPDRIAFDTFIAWAIGSQLLPRLRLVLPEVSPFIDMIEHELKIADILSAALKGDVPATYKPVRALAARIFDNLLLNRLFPEIERLVPPGQTGRMWCDEVARPSLLLVRNFVLDQLDNAVDGTLPNEDQLKAALGLLVSKIVLSNVVLFRDILVDHVRDSAASAARDLSQEVRRGGHQPLVAAFGKIPQLVMPSNVPAAVRTEATRNLAADLLLVTADATGDRVWTDARRARERELMRRILFSVFGEVDTQVSGSGIDKILAEIAGCTYLPAPPAAIEMVALQVETMAAVLDSTVPATFEAFARFYAVAVDAAVDQMAGAIAAHIRAGRDAIVAIGRRIEELAQTAAAQLAEAERLARVVADQLDRAARALRAPARRTEILDRLRDQGLVSVRNSVRSTPGYGLWPQPVRNAAIQTARNAFRTAFSAIRPVLDLALQVIGEIGNQIGRLFDQAADLADFMRRLAEQIERDINRQVNAIARLSLPDGIAIRDIIDTAVDQITKSAHIRNPLNAAFAARNDERTARQTLRSTNLTLSKQRAEKARQERALESAQNGAPIRANICSPRPASVRPDEGCAYDGQLPIRIAIEGIASTAAGTMDGKVQLFLNGKPLAVDPNAWRRDGAVFRLSHTVAVANSNLRKGVNVLECAAAGGGRPPARTSVVFAIAETPAADGVVIAVNNGMVTATAQSQSARASLTRWRAIRSDGSSQTINLRVPVSVALLDPTPPPGRRGAQACRRSITIVDHLGRHRFDHLLGDR